ncbi:MAG TPA: YbhB/YbcL family Raf kinase inhibitor-like protein [Candidatus Babeliales bacterium]|nr:YbhB/YbcL family Raf kinase inhibitor-like protein [Candidatus Babeliales bacterium]
MKLISPVFSHNEAIPTQYTCDGANISPALAWSDAPENTQSFALIVDDPDALSAVALAKEGPAKVWVHWIVFNIPATVDSLVENQGSTGEEVPFLQGATDFNGAQKWGGPCPPSGTHRYHFTLYALDIMLDLPAGASKEQLLSAMHGHILEKTTLIGTYQRKKQ